MKSNGKFLIVDLEVVREKGFEYFEKSEKWPVSESEFHEFSDFSRNLYNKIISNVDDAEVSDVAKMQHAAPFYHVLRKRNIGMFAEGVTRIECGGTFDSPYLGGCGRLLIVA